MMKKFVLIIGVAILSLMGALGVERPVRAVDITVTEGTCGAMSETFLFMRPWYYSLNCNSDGNLAQDQFSSDKMGDTIKKIVVVVIDDILRIVGVVAAGFLIFGGLRYAYSGGDVGKATKGKRTIQAAIIGMVIALVGQVAVNTFETIVMRAGGTGLEEENIVIGTVAGSLNIFKVQPDKLLGTTINFVLAAATLVSVGFIIYAGVNMTIAYGNTEKTTKARKAILYAIAGLGVSLLAFAIVNFALGGLQMAMPEGGNTDIFSLVNAIFGWIVGISGLLATIGIVVGGVQYTISSGDAAKVQRAKHTILYSIIGLAVVVLAGAIISFVIKAVFGS